MSEDKPLCLVDECRKIFVEIGMYYKSAMIGGLVLLGLILGLWTWSYAQYSTNEDKQLSQIQELQAFQNEISFIKSDAAQILANQKDIQRTLNEVCAYVRKIK